ncbi:unnamed protein product [Urochloa humidicola]
MGRRGGQIQVRPERAAAASPAMLCGGGGCCGDTGNDLLRVPCDCKFCALLSTNGVSRDGPQLRPYSPRLSSTSSPRPHQVHLRRDQDLEWKPWQHEAVEDPPGLLQSGPGSTLLHSKFNRGASNGFAEIVP